MKVIKQSAHIVKEWPNMNLYERCEFAGRISHASEDKIKEGSAEEFVRRMVRLGHESVFEFARIVHMIDKDDVHSLHLNLRQLRAFAFNFQNDKIGGAGLGIAKLVARKYPAFFEDINKDSLFWEPKEGWVVNGGWEEESDAFFYAWIPVLITTNRAISHQLVRYRKDVVYLQASQRYIKFHDDIEFISPRVYFDWGSSEESDWSEAMDCAENFYKDLLAKGCSAQAARLVLPNSTATKLIMYASPDTWRHVFEQRISDKADPMIRELLIPLKEQFDKEGLL